MDDLYALLSLEPLEFPKGIRLRRDLTRGTVRFLKAPNLSAALDADPAHRELQRRKRFDVLALYFVTRHRAEFRLQHPPSELVPVSVRTDELGLTHVKLQQHYAGLEVADAELIVHLDGEGRVYLVAGAYFPTPLGLDPQPALDLDEVRRAVARDLDLDCDQCPAELVIFVADGSEARLAYQMYVAASLLERWELLVAADTGAILRKLPTALPGGGPSPAE